MVFNIELPYLRFPYYGLSYIRGIHMSKAQTCCFTGHRNIPASEYPTIQERLASVLLSFIHKGRRYFGAAAYRALIPWRRWLY